MSCQEESFSLLLSRLRRNSSVQYSARLVVKQYENRGIVLDEFQLFDLHSKQEKTEASSVVRGENALTPTSASVLSGYKVKDLIHSTQAEDLKLLGLDENSSGTPRFSVHALVAMDTKGVRYYDHNLTEIEKTKLIDIIGQSVKGFTTAENASLPPYSVGKDKKLILIL